MKLWLHIGTPKTGTTSIQRVLHTHREMLLTQGVLYPDCWSALGGKSLNQGKLARALADGRAHRYREAEEYLLTLREALAHTVILSAESFWLHSWGNSKRDVWNGAMFERDWWERREKYLNVLAQHLVGFDVGVIVVLREREAFARSWWKTAVLRGKPVGSYETFRERIDPVLDYDAQIDAWRRIVGPVTVLSYEEIATDDRLVERFLDALGVEPPPYANTIRERRTPPDHVVEWAARMYARKPPRSVFKALCGFIENDAVCDADDLSAAFAAWWRNSAQKDLQGRIWTTFRRF